MGRGKDVFIALFVELNVALSCTLEKITFSRVLVFETSQGSLEFHIYMKEISSNIPFINRLVNYPEPWKERKGYS